MRCQAGIAKHIIASLLVEYSSIADIAWEESVLIVAADFEEHASVEEVEKIHPTAQWQDS